MLNKIKLLIKHIYLDFIYFILNNFVLAPKMRAKLFNFFFLNIYIKKDVSIRKNITFYNGSMLKGSLYIGEKCFFNDQCFLDYSSKLEIGDNVTVGMRTMILSSTHKIEYPIRCGGIKNKITCIEDNCWIGAGVIIYPGVKIGKGCVIAAGEIVYNDVPANMLLKQGNLIKLNEKN